jgi:uncharacterized SAM-binding protein YcdF (DUF218 family)
MEINLRMPRVKTLAITFSWIGGLVALLLGILILVLVLQDLRREETVYEINPIGGTDYICVAAYRSLGLDLSCFFVEGLEEQLSPIGGQ